MGVAGKPQGKTSIAAHVRQKTASLPAEAAGAAINVPLPKRLIYDGWLPKISNKIVHPMARYRLMKRGRKILGTDDLPWFLWAQGKASVEMILILGPIIKGARFQQPMDDDNLAILLSGLRDALKPAYIRDDSPKWATFTYRNDGTRRDMGPCILIEITYDQ
jgi:hypothetical protein